MAVALTYAANGRLTFGTVSCSCGLDHQQPQVDVYLDAGILGNLPEYIARRGLGKRCVLVADNITYPLAGIACEQLLATAGYIVSTCVIRRREAMDPDEKACGEVLLSIQPVRTLTHSCKLTWQSSSFSISALACEPIFCSISPLRPMMMVL